MIGATGTHGPGEALEAVEDGGSDGALAQPLMGSLPCERSFAHAAHGVE